MWGVWDDDEHRFAFSCGPRSRKAANLAANPQVSIAVDDTVECLSVEGRAARVTDEARRDLDRSLPREVPDGGPRPHRRVHAPNLVIELVPDRAFAVIEREDEFATRATRWRF